MDLYAHLVEVEGSEVFAILVCVIPIATQTPLLSQTIGE